MPVASPPIRDAAVAIDGDKIVFVGSRSEAETHPELFGIECHSLEQAAILPGLVNAHCHLELTVMRGFLEGLPFLEWITTLTRTRIERLTEADLQASALLGAAEAIRAGITTIADTGDTDAPFDALRKSGLRGIAYREVFGPNPDDAASQLAELQAKVEGMRERETERVKVGVSPHAPYTVAGELFRQVAKYATTESLDLCIHTAESEAEQQLMLAGEGDFAERFRHRGLDWQTPGVTTINYFDRLGVLAAEPLLIHCVRATDTEIALLAKQRARIVHCPKSNAKLGHGIAPLTQLLAAGVAVGMGSDSVASNNRCDLLEEARFCALLHRAMAKEFATPTATDLIRLLTLGGAQALRLDDRIGSLEAGKQADLIALDLSGFHNLPVNDVESAIIFSAASADVRLTMVAGEVLYDGGELNTIDEAELQRQMETCRLRLFPQKGS